MNVARTYANIGVVYLQLGKSIVAAAHLKKAQELIKLEELKDIMGPQTYSAFATTYDLAAESLYLSHPQQSLEYQLKSVSIPDQELVWYGRGNLKLAICYDRLLKPDESLICALDALKCKSLTSCEHDRALGYVVIGMMEKGDYHKSLESLTTHQFLNK